jgi:hypothetical protein
VGATAGTRSLTTKCYLTDDRATLLYVLDLPGPGEAVVEDVGTGEILCIKSVKLNGWRLVIPAEDADAA